MYEIIGSQVNSQNHTTRQPGPNSRSLVHIDFPVIRKLREFLPYLPKEWYYGTEPFL